MFGVLGMILGSRLRGWKTITVHPSCGVEVLEAFFGKGIGYFLVVEYFD